jgi:hypothetical protein|tara:strand:+ start:15 stop:170 length:156 start_codon:yes stop_codon:yes gene_type:complete
MSYQIGLILILVIAAIIIGKKYNKPNQEDDSLVYEDEMDKDELEKLDDEIN